MLPMVVEMFQKELLCEIKICFYSLKFLFNEIYLCDIKICFHSIKTNLYSKRNILTL